MPWSRRLLNRAVHRARGWVERAGAIQPGTDLADSFGTFGERSFISYPVVTLYGARSIHIGTDTLIGRSATMLVGYTPDDEVLPERGLVIGDRCVIGERVTLTAHQSIEIGDDVWFGQNVFVSDSGHGYQDVETPIGLQLANKYPVRIGAGSWLGHGAVVLAGANIGRHVVVGAGSVVRGTIPDYSVVVGAPARVVRRWEPGTGWVSTERPDDVRPAWTAAQVVEIMAGRRSPDEL